jgi:rhomboid protease GluP
MFGFAHLLRNVSEDMGFTQIIMWGCGALYLACLAVDPSGISTGGLLSLFSPSGRSLFLFGSSGAIPVFGFGRWWTVLSAAWLHAGVLHILFNMMWVRDLAPVTARLYGPGRTVIIYTVAAITGFLASSLVGAFLPFIPWPLAGARSTVGASAPIFGLIGALLHYGRRGASSYIDRQAKSLAIAMVVFGLIPGMMIDNWAHLGGFAGGWLAAKILDPLKPERGDHVLVAIGCLVLSALSVGFSVVEGLKLFRS